MPTTRGRNHDEQASGTIPRRANTNPNLAVADARRTSNGRVIVMPTPTAGPLIAPITGLVHDEEPQRHEAALVAVAAVGLLHDAGGGGTGAAVVERGVAPAEVGAGTERPTAPGNHHRPHLGIGVDLVERRAQLPLHGDREGVEPVRAVERDGGHAVGHVVGDLPVRHVSDPRTWVGASRRRP